MDFSFSFYSVIQKCITLSSGAIRYMKPCAFENQGIAAMLLQCRIKQKVSHMFDVNFMFHLLSIRCKELLNPLKHFFLGP